MNRRSLFVAILLMSCAAGFLQAQTNPVPGKPRWYAAIGAGNYSSPALSPDGSTVYVGSQNGYFYAFSTTNGSHTNVFRNTRKWSKNLGTAVSSPVVDSDGTIYVAGRNGVIYSIVDEETPSGPNAVVRALFATGKPITSSPAIGSDGTIYFGSDRFLFGISSTSTNKWAFNAGATVFSSPLVAPSGTIYFSVLSTLFGVSPSGAQSSKFQAANVIMSTPALGADGTLYFGANDEMVYAVGQGSSTNSTGTNSVINTNSSSGARWTFDTGQNILSSPAIGASGRIFIGSDSGFVFCLSSDGVLLWKFYVGAPVRSSLSIGADGTVYAGSDNGRLYAINPQGRAKWRVPFYTGGAVRSSPAVGSDGTVYVTSAAGRLWAINDSAVTAGTSPWPMFRRDARHSARATNGAPFIVRNLTLTNEVAGGDRYTNSILVSAGAPVTYHWRFPAATNVTTSNATIRVNNAQPMNAGAYFVIVSNEFGVVTSAVAQLIVNATPQIIADLTNRFISAGSLLTLQFQAAGSPNVTSFWHFNTQDVVLTANMAISNQVWISNAAFSGVLFITNAQPANSGNYDATVISGLGTNQTGTATVTVVQLALSRSTNNMISAGNRFSSALVSNQLFNWGNDINGQIGDGGGANKNVPVRVTTIPDWLAVSDGGRGFVLGTNYGAAHALALRGNGSLYAWGNNARGQLGITNRTDQTKPVQVGTNTDWIQVEAGASHSIGLRSNGTIWTWGGNEYGQLGHGHTNDVLVPAQMGLDSGWVEVHAGGLFSLARRADGTLWAWGRNDSRQFGTGTSNTFHKLPVQIGTVTNWIAASAGVSHSLALQADGTLWLWGRNFGLTSARIFSATNVFPEPVQVGSESNWIAIAAGYDHSLAINSNGQMFAWGANDIGQLGNGTNGSALHTNNQNQIDPVQIGGSTNTWTAIAAGMKHSIARSSDGTIWGWGWNNWGEVGVSTGGNGRGSYYKTPVPITFTNFFIAPPTTGAVVIAEQPVSVTNRAGVNVSFSVIAGGERPLVFSWRFNSNVVLTVTNSSPELASISLIITNVRASDIGSYDVIVSNSFGSLTSIVVTLTLTNTNTVSPPSPAPVAKAASIPAMVIENLDESLRLDTVRLASNTVLLSLQAPARRYVIEYKENLSDPNWIPLATNIGTGSLTNWHDKAAQGRSRFYRVRAP